MKLFLGVSCVNSFIFNISLIGGYIESDIMIAFKAMADIRIFV